jgi:hypothetical protein
VVQSLARRREEERDGRAADAMAANLEQDRRMLAEMG